MIETILVWVGLIVVSALSLIGTAWVCALMVDAILTKTKILKLITRRLWDFYDTLPRKQEQRYPIILLAWDTEKRRFMNHVGIDEYGRDSKEQKEFYRELHQKLKDEGQTNG